MGQGSVGQLIMLCSVHLNNHLVFKVSYTKFQLVQPLDAPIGQASLFFFFRG